MTPHPPQPSPGAPLPPKTRHFTLSRADRVLLAIGLLLGALLALWLFWPRPVAPGAPPTPAAVVTPVSTIVGPTPSVIDPTPAATMPSVAPTMPVAGSGGLLGGGQP